MAATVWKGFITFGLISIPVRLFRAARPERVSLRRLYRAGSSNSEKSADKEKPRSARAARADEETADADEDLAPVRQASLTEGSQRVLPKENLVKGFEYEKGRFVSVDDDELKAIAPETTTEMTIESCVALDEIDPVYFETSYYVVPEEAGKKAYALLYRALKASGLVALAKVAMHNREHVVVLRPGKKGLLAHTMYYPAEVRADEEFHAGSGDVSAKELELANTLIKSLAAPFEPSQYHDTYREKLQDIVDRKAAGKPAPKISSAEPRKRAEVVDIADALRKSLANLKKPAGTSQPAKKTKRASGH
jgi:DNA end-binding protein Ku